MTAFGQPDGIGCVAPGCRRMPTGGMLCPWHAGKLGQALADLAADLDGDVGPSLTGWRTGSSSGGPLASERDPINLRLLDAQRDAPPVLYAWAEWLCSRRTELTVPGTAEGNRKLLAEYLDWMCTQPEVRELWCQIRALWASLRGHRPVRRCTCGGPVWSEPGGGWCSWCSTAWAGRDLLELNRHEEAA